MDRKSNMLIAAAVFAVMLILCPFCLQTCPGTAAAESTVPENGEAVKPDVEVFGQVTDESGKPVPATIRILNENWTEVAGLRTNNSGRFSVVVPRSEKLSVSADSLASDPAHYIQFKGGYLAQKYFKMTKTVSCAGNSIEFNFRLPAIAALKLDAYSPEGELLQMGALEERVSPSWYGPVYGAFPIGDMDVPVPQRASIGQLRNAMIPGASYAGGKPYFAIPPNERVFLIMLWTVPGIGTIPLYADNGGEGYLLDEYKVQTVNLVYEFARTEYRRAREKWGSLTGQGYVFSSAVLDALASGEASLLKAGTQGDEKKKAAYAYDVLSYSIGAKETMVMEISGTGIAGRYGTLTVKVEDEAGQPVTGATVAYEQNELDFILGYGGGLNKGGTDPSYKAGLEIGFNYLYDMGELSWENISVSKSTNNFFVYNLMLERMLDQGWGVIAQMPCVGEDWVPRWAADLDFENYKKQVAEFVKAAVANVRGNVEYINIIVEPSLTVNGENRHTIISAVSDHQTALNTQDMIDLTKIMFDAARDAAPDIKLGYSVCPSFHCFQLNGTEFTCPPSPYTLLKTMLDNGVRPDYIGIELQHGVIEVPIDLCTVRDIIQAYHDLAGLPVILTEMFSYPTRVEDYGSEDPMTGIFWHDGMTEETQAEWNTSMYRIAMSLPYVQGVQMMHSIPDNPSWATDPYKIISIGTELLTMNYTPKKAYAAMKELFESWKSGGSLVTDCNGEASFSGLGGQYTISVSTEDGLVQDFSVAFDSAGSKAELRLDRGKAVRDINDLIETAKADLLLFWKTGRDLDYPTLRTALNGIGATLADGDLQKAKADVGALLDDIEIKIDGLPDDWKGVKPLAAFISGGVAAAVPGTDLKKVYGVSDGEFLYLMVEVHDPPISYDEGCGLEFYQIFPQFLFDIYNENREKYNIRLYLPFGGQAHIFNASSTVVATVYDVAYGECLELKVPLSLLYKNPPTKLSVFAFIMGSVNGREISIKGFTSEKDVILP
ncbi:MAG: endo-1,4-beta-xylanase [Clostridiales bacterium]|nr:endo-1,4-beta-xylanase [Clostridiales bacterium]